MRRGTRSGSAHGPDAAGARGAVQAAVSVAHHTRPASGTHAGQHAVWWARTASALSLIAEHEADTARADAARSDAATAQRLAQGMAAVHSSHFDEEVPVTEAAGPSSVVEEPAGQIGKNHGAGLAMGSVDVAELDDLAVGCE
jgi:hypothetical protein